MLRLQLPDGNVHGNPQEAGGREVMVEREGMAELLRAHDGEARRVDEAEVLVGVLTQQPERPCFGLLIDEDALEPPRLLEVVEKPNRRGMTRDHAQECVGLPDYVVRRDQGAGPREESAQCPNGAAVPLVVGYLHLKPGAGIDEDPARLHSSACSAPAPHVRGSGRDRAPRGGPLPSRLARSTPAGARLGRPRAETAGPPHGARGWTSILLGCGPAAPGRGPRPRAAESAHES